MPLSPGTRLGPYEIVAPLGAGGMGEVYRARDGRLGRDVAVKVLPPDFAGDAERLARFNDEARANAALSHPNILAVFDVGTEGGTTYLVSEILEGRTLRDVLDAETIAIGRVIDLAGQVADGLAAAHARGIVHRDLKPENIFVSTDGRAKILDFGLAKSLEPAAEGDEAETRAVTAPYVVLGSIGYMSPEQVRGLPADHRSDIFSFGCVLYEMLAGRRAFGGETVHDWMIAVTRDPPVPILSTATRPLSPLLLRIVDRCLEKAPAARFQSTTDLAFALKGLSTADSAIASGVHVYERSIAMPGSAPQVADVGRGRTWIPWAVTAIVAVASGAAIWTMQPEPAPPKRRYHLVITGKGDPVRTGANWEMFALSADGTRVVYSLVPAGTRPGGVAGAAGPLYVRRLDEAEAKAIPGTEGAVRPMLSPDGEWVAFTDASGSTIKRVPIAGGPAVVLANVVAGGTWARDGSLLLGERFRIGRLPAGGKSVETVLESDAAANKFYTHPQALPDGSILLTIRMPGQSKVGLMAAGGKTVKELEDGMHPRFIPPGYLIFARGATLWAATFDPARHELTSAPVPVLDGVLADLAGAQSNFSVSDDGSIAYLPGSAYGALDQSSSLVWLDRSGRNEQPTTFRPQAYTDGWLAPDGQSLLIGVQAESQSRLFVGDIERGTLSQVTGDVVTDYGWSSDGRRVDYRKADGSLWSRPADLSASEALLTDRKDLPGTDAGLVSRDGKWRVLSGGSPESRTASDIWLLDELNPTAPLKPLVQNAPHDAALGMSPDGRWLLYATRNPIGTPPNRDELHVQPFPGPGRVLPITPDGARAPYRWLGQEIVYRQLGGGTRTVLMSARVTTSGASVTVDLPRQLMDIQASYRWTDATRDGQRFLFRKDTSATSESDPAAELHVIVNWIEDVKQKLAAAKAPK